MARSSADVASQYTIGKTVSVLFYGANPRNNLGLESTFLTVEYNNGTSWVPVRYDGDFDTELRWVPHHEPNAPQFVSDVEIVWITDSDAQRMSAAKGCVRLLRRKLMSASWLFLLGGTLFCSGSVPHRVLWLPPRRQRERLPVHWCLGYLQPRCVSVTSYFLPMGPSCCVEPNIVEKKKNCTKLSYTFAYFRTGCPCWAQIPKVQGPSQESLLGWPGVRCQRFRTRCCFRGTAAGPATARTCRCTTPRTAHPANVLLAKPTRNQHGALLWAGRTRPRPPSSCAGRAERSCSHSTTCRASSPATAGTGTSRPSRSRTAPASTGPPRSSRKSVASQPRPVTASRRQCSPTAPLLAHSERQPPYMASIVANDEDALAGLFQLLHLVVQGGQRDAVHVS